MTEDTPSAQRSSQAVPTGEGTETANGAGSARQHDVVHTHVALIGRAGAGKTTLAQALFGAQNEPTVTGAIERYQDDATPVIVDDLPGWVNGSESSLSVLFSYLEDALSADDRFAAIWYALDAVSARVTDYELQLIRRFAQMYPVVVALTRTDLVSAEALAAMQSAIEEAAIPNCLGVIATAADPLPAMGVPPYGVDEVVTLITQHDLQPRHDLPEQPDVATKRIVPSADQLERRQAPSQDRPSQTPTGAQRAAPRPERMYERAEEKAVRREQYGLAATGVTSSGTLLAILVVVSLVLALLLLGRRHRNSA